MKKLKKISLKEEILAEEEQKNNIKIDSINVDYGDYEISFTAQKLSKTFKSIYTADEELASKPQNELLDFIYESLPNNEEEIALYAYFINKHDEEEAFNEYLENKNTTKIEGGEYNHTYIVDYKTIIMDEEIAEGMARDRVLEDLENEPEMFNQDWLSDYIYISDTDRRLIAQEEADRLVEDYEYEGPERLLEAANMDLSEYEEADESTQEELLNKAREEVSEKIYDDMYDRLEDPIEYFVNEQGIYSLEDLMKQSFIRIDIEEAADNAISTDGWEHFLGGVEYIDNLEVWIID